MESRHFSPIDEFISAFDQGLRTIFGKPEVTERADPADSVAESELNDKEKDLAIRLMRVNHAGEVAAQALYQGQAIAARNSQVKNQMQRSADEENDHLAWCEKRVKELGGHTSRLGPFWFMGSFAIGSIAGLAGDKWSLGFVVETERQVEKHLDAHLEKISKNDEKTRAILQQMKIDEAQHASKALRAGGAPLPAPVKQLMRLTSKVMTKTAYWI